MDVSMALIGGALILILTLVVPFLLLTPRPPNPPVGLPSPEWLERHIEALTANETPPALNITVIKDGVVAWDKAFGFSGPGGPPVSPESVYHFWSVTKLFTATAIMQLVEDGAIGLDDPVAKYIPDFVTAHSRTPMDITIRQLLDHTSGMKNLGPGDLLGWIHHLGDPPVDQSALVRDRLRGYQTLSTPPGKTASYSNVGYILLGAIIECASGQSYEDCVRTRILGPLGMTSTDFVYRSDLLPRAVSGSHPFFHMFTPLLAIIHRDWFSRWVERTARGRMWLAPLYTDYTAPTGLIGTGRDLARFGLCFLSGGMLDGVRILRTETVARMLNEGYAGPTGPDRDCMGLGWHWWKNASTPFKGHGGEGPGFSAQIALVEDSKLVVVVLANDTLTDRVGLTNRVIAAFLQGSTANTAVRGGHGTQG